MGPPLYALQKTAFFVPIDKFKGDPGTYQHNTSVVVGTFCRPKFQEGVMYVLFADQTNGVLTTNDCKVEKMTSQIKNKLEVIKSEDA